MLPPHCKKPDLHFAGRIVVFTPDDINRCIAHETYHSSPSASAVTCIITLMTGQHKLERVLVKQPWTQQTESAAKAIARQGAFDKILACDCCRDLIRELLDIGAIDGC